MAEGARIPGIQSHYRAIGCPVLSLLWKGPDSLLGFTPFPKIAYYAPALCHPSPETPVITNSLGMSHHRRARFTDKPSDLADNRLRTIMSTRRPKRAPFVLRSAGRCPATTLFLYASDVRSPDGPSVLALSQLARVSLSALRVLCGDPLLLNLRTSQHPADWKVFKCHFSLN